MVALPPYNCLIRPISPSVQHIVEQRAESPPANEIYAREPEPSVISDAQRDYDMKMFQMMVTAMRLANEAPPITINNISASKAAAEQTVVSHEKSSSVPPSRPSLEILSEMFHTFFSSGFNRVCFFGAFGMGMYIYWSYLDHKWHMAEVQRRIDSNIVLRMTQWLFDSPAMKREVAPTSFRIFPSLW
jgi:hypothetical protein